MDEWRHRLRIKYFTHFLINIFERGKQIAVEIGSQSMYNICQRKTHILRSFKMAEGQEVVTGDRSNELWWCRNI